MTEDDWDALAAESELVLEDLDGCSGMYEEEKFAGIVQGHPAGANVLQRRRHRVLCQARSR